MIVNKMCKKPLQTNQEEEITFFFIGKKKFYWKMISMRKHKVHDSEQEEEICKKKANKH